MADPVSTAISYVGSIVGFSAKTPIDLLLNIILPIPILTYAFGLLLERLGIFRNSGVRYLIGAIMAVTLVFIVKIGALGLWLGIAGVFIFKVKDWPSRIIAFVIFGILISQIGFSFDQNVLLSKMLFLGFTLAALLVVVSDINLIIKIILVIALYAAYFFVLPYLAAFGI